MFTGLVQEVGSVAAIEPVTRGVRLAVVAPEAAAELRPGDSVAVDGVCLTAVEIDGDRFATEVSPETLERSNLGEYEEGTEVNIELPLAAGARLGGHFVQGHVDATTRQEGRRDEGGFVRVRYRLPRGLVGFLVEKGSVAINGVSLTVAALEEGSGEGRFDVQLVPHTLERTNLLSERRADTMNLEVDVLGKYVARLLAGVGGGVRGGAGAVRETARAALERLGAPDGMAAPATETTQERDTEDTSTDAMTTERTAASAEVAGT